MSTSRLFVFLACCVAPSVAQAVTKPAELGAAMGLDAAAIARVLAGELVSTPPAETSDRDLAVGFTFLSKRPPEELAAGFRRGADLADDPSVVASHRIARAGAAEDFATLKLAPHGAEEAKRYLSAQDGDVLNLSEAEIAAFRALGADASQALVEAQLRKTLLARHDAYRARGLAGLVPYARDHGKQRDLGEGLRVLAQSPAPLQRYATALRDILRAYPKTPAAGVEETFYWIVYDHDDRPTITLRHRLSTVVDGVTLVADREFYVSQGYNEMQALAAFFPVEGGTMIFYRADTSTDRVSGSGSAMKHSIGRRMMAKQLRAIFERGRAKREK